MHVVDDEHVAAVPLDMTGHTDHIVIHEARHQQLVTSAGAAGVGAGLCDVTARFLLVSGHALAIPTIGASGAIYGLLLAFGVLYPNRTIFLYFLFPIPARIFVLILGTIAFLSTFGAAGSGISHMAHLGGMIFGFYYLRFRPRLFDIDWIGSLRLWKRRQTQQRFEVYMRKQNRGRPDDWVN